MVDGGKKKEKKNNKKIMRAEIIFYRTIVAIYGVVTFTRKTANRTSKTSIRLFSVVNDTSYISRSFSQILSH